MGFFIKIQVVMVCLWFVKLLFQFVSFVGGNTHLASGIIANFKALKWKYLSADKNQ
ncbi:hypothetical protein TUM4249_06160 [Shewanella sp. KT0246]|nr:hypothetical protein TUM4249_06160 [Shewanella sp. KT0246]